MHLCDVCAYFETIKSYTGLKYLHSAGIIHRYV